MADRTLPPTGSRALKSGDRVRVTQAIHGRTDTWTSSVEGIVVSSRAEPTGSWFAHGKGDRLWLKRLRLRKDDGEITNLVIDDSTRIEIVDRAAS